MFYYQPPPKDVQHALWVGEFLYNPNYAAWSGWFHHETFTALGAALNWMGEPSPVSPSGVVVLQSKRVVKFTRDRVWAKKVIGKPRWKMKGRKR